jgi:hypothetical protein
MGISSILPEDRSQALYYYFGWKGGTIHQLAESTGVPALTLLYDNSDGELTGGFSAIRTCDLEWRVERLAPLHQGDWPYWRDAIKGFWATGPLG